MKIPNRFVAIIILAIIVLAVVLPSCIKINTGGQNSSQLVSDAALSSSIDAQSRPFNASNTFNADTDMIYMSMKLNNAPANTHVRLKVTYTGGDAASAANSIIFDKSQLAQGTMSIAFPIKPPSGVFYVGDYIAVVYANDQEQVSTNFKVQNAQTKKGWPEVKKFTATPDTVTQGQQVTLSWEVSDATRITMQPEIGTIPASGTRSITPSSTITYKIIAANDTASTTREVTVNVGAPSTGVPDLVVTDVWLQGSMVYYKIKNIGTVDSKSTTSYIYIDNMYPPLGGTSYCEIMKPGQERTLTFSSYQWPYGLDTAASDPIACGGTCAHMAVVEPRDYNINHTVKVCADAKAELKESSESNNCMRKNWGVLMKVDLLQVAHLAKWTNSQGEQPRFGVEGSTTGAYIPLSGGGLETVPPPVPQGWIQGTWGFFYVDKDTRAAQSAPVVVPAKGKFIARVGLSENAKNSDGVTFKIGMRDMSDNVNFLPGKKMTVPGKYETWEIDLSDYEDQKAYFLLRVEAGATATDDFAVWQEARLEQME
jgi:hypothetical protein